MNNDAEVCEINVNPVKDEEIEKILRENKNIAVVGISTKPDKPSYQVAAYLKAQGYKIFPVNPVAEGEILGEKVYKSLSEIPEKIDIVDIFRKPSDVPPVVDEAIKTGAKGVWLQEGIVHNESAQKAISAGLFFVQDKCIAKEVRKG